MASLTQGVAACHPVPDLSPEDLEFWEQTSAAALAPMPEATALASASEDWAEYHRWSESLDEPFTGYHLTGEAEAERERAYAAWEAYSLAYGRWVDGRGPRPV